MSDDHTMSAPTSGADWEIGEAARKLSEALALDGVQSAALRAALSDHATAVGSKSTAMIAGLFGPVMRGLEATRSDLADLARQRTDDRRLEETYRGKMLDWRVELRDHIDKRFDAFGQELDTRVGALEQDLAAFKVDSRRDRMEIRAILAELPESEQLIMIRDMQERLKRVELRQAVDHWATFIPLAVVVFILLAATLLSLVGGR